MTLHISSSGRDSLSERDLIMLDDAMDAIKTIFFRYDWRDHPKDDRLYDVELFIANFIAKARTT